VTAALCEHRSINHRAGLRTEVGPSSLRARVSVSLSTRQGASRPPLPERNVSKLPVGVKCDIDSCPGHEFSSGRAVQLTHQSLIITAFHAAEAVCGAVSRIM